MLQAKEVSLCQLVWRALRARRLSYTLTGGKQTKLTSLLWSVVAGRRYSYWRTGKYRQTVCWLADGQQSMAAQTVCASDCSRWLIVYFVALVLHCMKLRTTSMCFFACCLPLRYCCMQVCMTSHSDEYYSPYKADDGVWVIDYCTLATSTVQDHSFCDMLGILALSCVVQKPIQTRWPVTSAESRYVPLTKLVIGRDVQTLNAVNVLWTW